MENTTLTPIEKWIEEDAIAWNEKQQFQSNFIANRPSYLAGLMAMLTYLGLQGIDDPKLWIEEYKVMESFEKQSSHMIRMQAKEILNLKTKDKYSEEVIRVLKEANEQLKAERSAAIVEVCRLRDEVNSAKCEGWEEGKIVGITIAGYIEFGIDTEIINPYKGE